MSAWDSLLAFSSLSAGTARQLLDAAKGGTFVAGRTAWQALRAGSALTVQGSAWQFLNAPGSVGSSVAGTLINDGITVEVDTGPIAVYVEPQS
jgi:hypothetical protein